MFSRFISDFSFSLQVLLAGHRTTSASLVCQDILSALLKGHQTGKSSLLSGLEGFWGGWFICWVFFGPRFCSSIHPLISYWELSEMKNFVYSAWGEIRESFSSFGTASHCSCLQRTCIFVVVKTVHLRDCWKMMEKGVINFKPSSSEIAASWLSLIQIPLASLKKSIVCWKNESLLSNKQPFTFKSQSRILCC